MENYKNKRRKGLGGFPARCAGCLLALFVLFNSFTAFAFTNSTTEDTYDISVLPTTRTLIGQYWAPSVASDLYNVWLFVDEDFAPDKYFLVFTVNMINDFGYSYLYDSSSRLATGIYNSANGTQIGLNSYDYVKVYYYQDGVDSDWTLASRNSNRFYGSSFGAYSYKNCYFDSSNLKLLAVKFQSNNINVGTNGSPDYVRYYDVSNFSNLTYANYNLVDLQCYFNEYGELLETSSEPEEPEEPVYNGPLSLIINWLTQIKNGITDFFTNFSTYLSNGISVIQGWLTNLGTTIGGFFSDLWDDLDAGFTAIKDTIIAPFIPGPPPGPVYTFFHTTMPGFFADLADWFSDLGDRISGFFIDLVDDIKGLFIPDDTWWSTFRQRWDTFLNAHFGGLIQAEEVVTGLIGTNSNTRNRSITVISDIKGLNDREVNYLTRNNATLLDLLNFEQSRDYTISFPHIEFPVPVSLYEPGVVSFGTEASYSLRAIFNSISTTFDFFYYWNMAVNALTFLWGLIHLKKMFDELIGKSTKKGDFDL